MFLNDFLNVPTTYNLLLNTNHNTEDPFCKPFVQNHMDIQKEKIKHTTLYVQKPNTPFTYSKILIIHFNRYFNCTNKFYIFFH